jgi:cellulose synthase/poly-beta-1,6-N-acetylglucosamine synthase-like glycosyltransferase
MDKSPTQSGRVSIIVPTYNHAHFLGEALSSALGQTYGDVEVIVVDDGSTDHTGSVVAAFPAARYQYQSNAGLAAARNSGWTACTGEFVIFLDADDRLLPDAAALGVDCLSAADRHAFASGEHRYIDRSGAVTRTWASAPLASNHYEALLRGNYIGMIATVVFRRSALEASGGFSSDLRACEDYDLYLRLSSRFPVLAHGGLVAEYRRYGEAMSDDPALMLGAALRVMNRHRSAASRSLAHLRAFEAGLEYWRSYYAPRLVECVRRDWLSPGRRRRALSSALQLARTAPRYVPRLFIDPTGR